MCIYHEKLLCCFFLKLTDVWSNDGPTCQLCSANLLCNYL